MFAATMRTSQSGGEQLDLFKIFPSTCSHNFHGFMVPNKMQCEPQSDSTTTQMQNEIRIFGGKLERMLVLTPSVSYIFLNVHLTSMRLSESALSDNTNFCLIVIMIFKS